MAHCQIPAGAASPGPVEVWADNPNAEAWIEVVAFPDAVTVAQIQGVAY